MNNRKIALMVIPILASILVFPIGNVMAGGCGPNGTDGNDKIQGTDGFDCVNSGDGNDKISTGDGGDQITPGDGIDRVAAGDGDDTILLENDGDKDRILCGDGNDRVFYVGAGPIDPLDILKDCENIIDNTF